jgi:hypothetical protein
MHVNADGRWQAPNYMDSHKNRTLRNTRPGHALPAELNADGDMVRTVQYVPVSLQRWNSLHRCQLPRRVRVRKVWGSWSCGHGGCGLESKHPVDGAVLWPMASPQSQSSLDPGALSCRRPVLPCIPLIGTAYSPLRLLRNGLPVPLRTQAIPLVRRCSLPHHGLPALIRAVFANPAWLNA